MARYPEVRTPLDEARKGLVVRHLPLARRIARSQGRRFPWLRDELLGEAYYALVKAAQLCRDPGEIRGPFGPHATTCILRRLVDFRRARMARKRAPLAGLPGDHPAPGDPATDALEAADWLAARGAALIPADLAALRADAAGLAHREIAAAWGVDQAAVSRRVRRGLALLRARAAAEA